MSLQKPGGQLTGLSILWLIGGLGGLALGLMTGKLLLTAVFAVFLLATVGLWFQSQASRYFLLVWFAIVIVLAVVALITKGFKTLYVGHVVLSLYSIFALYTWEIGADT